MYKRQVRHLGTEYAGSVLAAMHDYLTTQTHTTFAELTTATDILVEDGRVTGVRLSPRKGEPWVAKSAQDVYKRQVIVTHEMQFARQVADNVMFMDGGVIVEYGPPEEVIGNPKQERTRHFLERYAQQ